MGRPSERPSADDAGIPFESPNFVSSVRLVLWGLCQLVRHGWPRCVITSFSGLGDELMTAAALRELAAAGRCTGAWYLTRQTDLFKGSRLPVSFLPWDLRYLRLAERFRRPIYQLGYASYDPQTDRDTPLPGHAIATLCRQLGLKGTVTLKPHLELTQVERESGRRAPRQIAVQSGSRGAWISMQTKQWIPGRMQAMVDALRLEYSGTILQLGTPDEPKLQGAEDLRGRTTLRESAAILSQSDLFVGLVGGLMHLARAVDCHAVIVYGGREDPALAGYAGHVHLATRPPCSPCYLRNRCPNQMVCMDAITVDAVLAAIRSELLRRDQPLPQAVVQL